MLFVGSVTIVAMPAAAAVAVASVTAPAATAADGDDACHVVISACLRLPTPGSTYASAHMPCAMGSGS